jgi:ribosome-associated protein
LNNQSQIQQANDTSIRRRSASTAQLVSVIIDSILDKKGERVVSMNLSNLSDAMTDYFVICEANSPTQVRAIADHIEEKVQQSLQMRINHIEGIDTAEWVLVDYFDVMVHIFLREKRELFALEELWADAATTTEYNEDGSTKHITEPQTAPKRRKK